MPVKDPNANNKTIIGKDIIFLEKDGRSIFLYKSGDQFVNINAPNEKLIEEIVV